MGSKSDGDSDSHTPQESLSHKSKPSNSSVTSPGASPGGGVAGDTRNQIAAGHQQVNLISEEDDAMDISSIQGEILTGYLKDHQTMIFLRILEGEEGNFHTWLGNTEPLLGMRGGLPAHNNNRATRLWPGEHNSPHASWVNIAFSQSVLERLARTAPQLKSHYFMPESAEPQAQHGDTRKYSAEGRGSSKDNHNSIVGIVADAVLIVASNNKSDMAETVARIEQTISGLRDANGRQIGSGAEVMFKQIGTTLEAPIMGHEQFGFRDGTQQSASGARLTAQLENFLLPHQHSNKHGKTTQNTGAEWVGKQADQTADAVYTTRKRVTYSAMSHEYVIDFQENAKRQFIPVYLGLPGLVPSDYLRAWRQVPHHTSKGIHVGQPEREVSVEDGQRRSAKLHGLDQPV